MQTEGVEVPRVQRSASPAQITGATAQIWGLPERGLLRDGMAADVVIFDPDTIARGVDTGIVSGEVVYSPACGYTGARPGVVANAP